MGILRSMICVLAACTLFNSPVFGQAKKSDLDSASELVKSGHAEQALALVEPIIAKAMLADAKDASAICPGAAVAFLQAFTKSNLTFSVENDWCVALLVKAYALNELKRPAEAEAVLKGLIGHDPKNPQFLSEYAYTVRLNGGLERSLNLYKQAARLGLFNRCFHGAAPGIPARNGAG